MQYSSLGPLSATGTVGGINSEWAEQHDPNPQKTRLRNTKFLLGGDRMSQKRTKQFSQEIYNVHH